MALMMAHVKQLNEVQIIQRIYEFGTRRKLFNFIYNTRES